MEFELELQVFKDGERKWIGLLTGCLCVLLVGTAAAMFLGFRELRKKNAMLKEELEAGKADMRRTQDSMRDLYLSRLLGGGHFRSREEAAEAGEGLGIVFPYESFRLLMARPEEWGESFQNGEMDWNDSNFILRNTLENSFDCVTYAAVYQGKMAAIINMNPEKTGLQEILRNTQDLVEVLESEFGITATIAVSRIYDSILELKIAADDVDRIYDYLGLLGEDRPITAYEELTHLNIVPAEGSYLELESRLLGCIRASDFSGAGCVLHEMIQGQFGDAKPTVDTCRFRVYGVVNTLLYMVDDIRSVVGNDVIARLDPGPRLTSAATLEEIVAVMDDILNGLEEEMGEIRQNSTAVWVQNILPFVEENYTDPNMSVSSIADHFGISSTYCSKMFKERYGVRLFDCIQRRRIERAKELISSGKTLAEAADGAGFNTALTLSRNFKRYEGTTPGKAREARVRDQSREFK